MGKSPRLDRLATGPFKLIETPIHAQKTVKPYDQYLEAASGMALGHNAIIRGLNSIYLQAPNITSEDALDFINYAKCWHEVVNGHHEMEETFLFPNIETKTGEKGIMEKDVEQHHAFLPGLKAYKSYLDTCSNNQDSFSGTHLNQLIDAFAPKLLEHLHDEIPSLVSLSRFGDKLPLRNMIAAGGRKTEQSLTGGTAFFFRNLDFDFEEGLWGRWPPVPAPVWFVLQKTAVAWNGRWWRFASADANGHLKELPAWKS